MRCLCSSIAVFLCLFVLQDLESDDVGRAALFLLSPLARGITGTTLYVDNGLHAMGQALDSKSLSP